MSERTRETYDAVVLAPNDACASKVGSLNPLALAITLLAGMDDVCLKTVVSLSPAALSLGEESGAAGLDADPTPLLPTSWLFDAASHSGDASACLYRRLDRSPGVRGTVVLNAAMLSVTRDDLAQGMAEFENALADGPCDAGVVVVSLEPVDDHFHPRKVFYIATAGYLAYLDPTAAQVYQRQQLGADPYWCVNNAFAIVSPDAGVDDAMPSASVRPVRMRRHVTAIQTVCDLEFAEALQGSEEP